MTNKISLDTVIKYEVNAIRNQSNHVVSWDMKVVIHTPDGDIPVLYPEQFDRLKDYIDHFSDVINLKVAIPAGVYYNNLFPHKDKLEVSVIFIPLLTTTVYNKNENAQRREKRYIARLTDMNSHLVESNTEIVANQLKSNTDSIISVTFQLIDKVVMALRAKTVGMIIRNATAIDAIKFCLTEYSRNLDSGDSEQIKGVNVVDGFSQEVREHIIIPHLTHLTSVPKHINETTGGVYSTGFSYYLQNNFWYVYPLYDTNRFAKADKTLTIINIPANRTPGIEKTFRVTDTQVIMISTGRVRHIDVSNMERDSIGDTVRFIDSKTVIEAFGEKAGNKFTTNYAKNVTEASIDENHKDPTRSQLANKVKITNAYNLEFSKLAERNGSRILVTWENSDDSFLYPGMPVRYIFVTNGEPRQLYGTLLSVETTMMPVNQNPKQKKFSATTMLTCFVTRDINNRKVL